MKLPIRISILGQSYRVKRERGLIKRDGIEGYVSAHEYLIVVDAALRGLVLRRVLYHEICHAWCFESGLHEILSAQAIEMTCQSFSALFEQIKGKV